MDYAQTDRAKLLRQHGAVSCRVQKVAGACACGAVRYRLEAPPLFVHACHCRHCQRESGSAFVVNAVIEADRVVLLSGEVQQVKLPTASGRGHWVARCSVCQVALWSSYGSVHAVRRYVRVGTLDRADDFPPAAHIHVSSKQPWMVLAQDVPAFRSHYDAAKVWPQNSLQRYLAATVPGKRVNKL